jgi:hypothetical protein
MVPTSADAATVVTERYHPPLSRAREYPPFGAASECGSSAQFSAQIRAIGLVPGFLGSTSLARRELRPEIMPNMR